MPRINKNNSVITPIVIFSVEPERQQNLIDIIIDFLPDVEKQAGFVSASLHKSMDGEKVVNYAQWQSIKDYEGFLENPNLQSGRTKLSEFNRPDSHIYEIAISESKVGIPSISKGGLTHIAEFRMQPENQARLVELEQENVTIAMEHPDLLSATFHRSLDGTRTINYGQWRSLDNFDLLLKEPKYESVREYWKELAENEFHLYQVVHTVGN
ncbi:antibiotic biosynthesis monooxygenase family protein [Mastigocoleus testarum]|uniref:Antibiotic biosynthesis monooxygenase n=1 Tax=Mastigocoleus testarum BC008 TaxID=371196 RepID=A0A0V7ZNA2_9CYAN|nr:antibiotic biosynthesis monooxygenase [Mastigocoleus testarum]KST66180.1 antibiotic biosynthesis monooxygenase [Mastigocoleus testarum BC008]